MTNPCEIPDDRDLTGEEEVLIRWLLLHGTVDAPRFLADLDKARVASRCYCGCATINFAIDGVVPTPGEPIGILADYEWKDANGYLLGAFVFERYGLLAGLEIWSQDCQSNADVLPRVEQLHPIGTIVLSSKN